MSLSVVQILHRLLIFEFWLYLKYICMLSVLISNAYKNLTKNHWNWSLLKNGGYTYTCVQFEFSLVSKHCCLMSVWAGFRVESENNWDNSSQNIGFLSKLKIPHGTKWKETVTLDQLTPKDLVANFAPFWLSKWQNIFTESNSSTHGPWRHTWGSSLPLAMWVSIL